MATEDRAGTAEVPVAGLGGGLATLKQTTD